MRYPKLGNMYQTRQTIDVFGGYNHNLRLGDNEFFEMQNMTSDHYPVLSPRAPRGSLPHSQGSQGLVVNQGLCRIVNGEFLLPDGTLLEMDLDDRPKTLVSMGAYVIILPDKKWVNVAACLDGQTAGECYGNMEESLTTTVKVELCREDGTVYNGGEITEKKPADPEEGKLWMDIDGEKPVLKKWSSDMGLWTVVQNAYTKLTFTDIARQSFCKGDAVTVSADPPVAPVGDILGDWYVCLAGGNYLVVDAKVTRNVENATLTVARRIPDMDYVVECGNRLWGCRYGNTEKGFVNEIYASKLGDFKNWYCFRGISTDSYVASVGADGPFTGAASYRGNPYFFKENCMIQLYGSYPAEFRLQTTACEGVQAGCGKSLAVVDNILFYKARTGVCAFDGSLPVQIGQALGQKRYENAVAGGCAGKYYISMQEADTQDGWQLFVYDTARGLWHREDGLQALQLCSYRNTLYCILAQGDILTLAGGEATQTAPVEWMVQTGDIGISLPEMKYISRLQLRLQLALGAEVSVFVRYDRQPKWEHLFTLQGTQLRSFTVPVRPRRCDTMQLMLRGQGEAKVYSITKVIERGSDDT